MSAIGVSVGRSASGGMRISVRNNGKGIPTSMHATENIHIPELIFGHLLTGSNFNDEQVNMNLPSIDSTSRSHVFSLVITFIIFDRVE